MLLKILFDYLKAYRYFLYELEPEPEPVKKIPGAGQKRTGSATLPPNDQKRQKWAH